MIKRIDYYIFKNKILMESKLYVYLFKCFYIKLDLMVLKYRNMLKYYQYKKIIYKVYECYYIFYNLYI